MAPASSLMHLLIECENRLGWIPQGKNLWSARAAMHRILSRKMEQQRISERDIALAINYCVRRAQPITSPLELLRLVPEARLVAAPAENWSLLDLAQADAIAWEQQRLDDDTAYWIGRILNSLGAGLSDVLVEWRAAGRG